MVPGGIGDVAPWPDWGAAARGALEFLHEPLVEMVARMLSTLLAAGLQAPPLPDAPVPS